MQTKYLDSTEEYLVAAHEIGHVVGGDHAYARGWWYGWYYNGSYCSYKYTIMKTNVKLDCHANEFNNKGTTDRFNAWRVRYCAANKASCPSLISSGT